MSPVPGLVADVVRQSVVDGPGNRYVVFLQGCGFDCLTCHNPQTRPLSTPRARTMSVDDVLSDLRPIAAYLSGITVSGGEATLQAEFVHDVFAAVKRDPALGALTTLVDSNGDATRETWDRLLPVMDGAMLDLKAIDPDVHVRLTGTSNAQVLDSIVYLADNASLYEVRLLLVPGYNDDAATLQRTAEWLLVVDPDVRVKVIGFRRHGARASAQDIEEPDAERREEYRRILESAGLTVAELV